MLKNDLCNVTLLSNRIRYNLNNHPWTSSIMANLINSYNLFTEGTWANSKTLSRTNRDFMNSVYEIQEKKHSVIRYSSILRDSTIYWVFL